MAKTDGRVSPLRRLVSRGGFLLVTAVALYLVAPSLLEVLSSWDQVSQLQPIWLALASAAQVVAFAFVWSLQRLVLRTKAWLPVITSQLAGNAAGRLVPGGPATGAAVQFRLLRSAGVSTANATSGLTTAGLLQFATTLAMPVVALPGVLLGAPAPETLLAGAWVGAALFVVLLALVVAVLVDDRALKWLGWCIDAGRRRLPGTRPSDRPASVGLLAERDALLDGLGNEWLRAAAFAVGRAAFDYLSLLTAVAAFGADARPSLLLLAFATSSLLGMIPLTPGGLGFVEAGLTGTLTLAGVSPAQAISAALLYRLVSFWLPIPAGMIAGVVHRVRFGVGRP